MSTILASRFYKTSTPDGDLISWLATFAVGFIVRPFGALVFGALGDLWGRKYTFAVTLITMGACTFLMGCLPTIDQVGVASGYLLIILRIIQGLAIGGEYGGAATFIAEHAPQNQRGFWTSFIQITATGGMLLSLLVIIACKVPMGDAKFAEWGWRLPFLLSIFLVGMALWIRLKLHESPLYADLKAKGKAPTSIWQPFRESFGRSYNLYYVVLSLFGATMGQGAVWYTAQFYFLTFIQKYAFVPVNESYYIVLVALLFAAPFFILFGTLSDRYGRKWFMVAGLTFSVALWYPIYQAVLDYNYKSGQYNPYLLSFLCFVQVVFVAMVYGPIAAFLVELFPTEIRYTSMSLPYHIGNGVFGGLVPVLGVTIISLTGSNIAGIYFPLGCGIVTLIIMVLFVPETYQTDITQVKANSYKQANMNII
ncbi:general substrate transporter [Gorgonomyces haynaldii]|nr:general substrate transporter [Gorgonomyces haynaldii]